jgi:ABC-2 type transport system ATP-binding protein
MDFTIALRKKLPAGEVMSDYAILLNNVSRSFGPVHALQEITFSVGHGEIMALVGANGSGKSTTISLLLGLLRPSHGTVQVLGHDPFTHPKLLKNRVSVLLDKPKEEARRLTVRESLQSPGQLSHAAEQAEQARIDELLHLFELWPHRHRTIAELNRSSRQRVAIAAAVVHRPALVLLDDPVAEFDALNRRAMVSILRDLVHADNATLFFTTSALEDAAIADTVGILSQGRLVTQGPLTELLNEDAAPSLQVTGRGFTDEVLTLLQRRPEVAAIHRLPDGLRILLSRSADTSPLISLLVESSADIDEVRKINWDISTRYQQLLAKSHMHDGSVSFPIPDELIDTYSGS